MPLETSVGADKGSGPNWCRALWFVSAALLLGFASGCYGPEAPKGGVYKVGEPYQIEGAWYYPAADDSYEEVGVASWYGPNFQGRPTANGETFDMYQVSAAHRTLPLPSMVEVTNLENGRTLRVRINDRGPFARGRIIDLSKRGAELLGFRGQGTTRVKVRILADESRSEALQAQARAPVNGAVRQAGAAPVATVQAENLPPPQDSGSAEPQNTQPAKIASTSSNGRFYVQAGAFSNLANARKLRDHLASLGPQARIVQSSLGSQTLYKVRLGPAADEAAAGWLLERVAEAGVLGAQVVAE